MLYHNIINPTNGPYFEETRKQSGTLNDQEKMKTSSQEAEVEDMAQYFSGLKVLRDTGAECLSRLPLNRDSTCEWDRFLQKRSMALKREEEKKISSPTATFLRRLENELQAADEVASLPPPPGEDKLERDLSSHSCPSLPTSILQWLEKETPEFLKEDSCNRASPSLEDGVHAWKHLKQPSSMEQDTLSKEQHDQESDTSSEIQQEDTAPKREAKAEDTSLPRFSLTAIDSEDNIATARLPLQRDSTCEWDLILKERSLALRREEGSSRSSLLPLEVLQWLQDEVPGVEESEGETMQLPLPQGMGNNQDTINTLGPLRNSNVLDLKPGTKKKGPIELPASPEAPQTHQLGNKKHPKELSMACSSSCGFDSFIQDKTSGPRADQAKSPSRSVPNWIWPQGARTA